MIRSTRTNPSYLSEVQKKDLKDKLSKPINQPKPTIDNVNARSVTQAEEHTHTPTHTHTHTHTRTASRQSKQQNPKRDAEHRNDQTVGAEPELGQNVVAHL